MKDAKKPLSIPSVVKMPIETQVTVALRESIINGVIAGGARITEVQLSDQMTVSRTTVRTALHQLAKEGLLTLIPYTGWTVVLLTARDVWELYTVRSAIERLAAQLTAKSMTEDKAKQLTSALAELRTNCRRGDAISVAESDFALHKTIIRLADHSRLASQYELIEQQIRMYIRSSDALMPEIEGIMDQHTPIVEAILRGDADRGGSLSEQHNLTEGAKLSDHLSALETQVDKSSSHRH